MNYTAFQAIRTVRLFTDAQLIEIAIMLAVEDIAKFEQFANNLFNANSLVLLVRGQRVAIPESVLRELIERDTNHGGTLTKIALIKILRERIIADSGRCLDLLLAKETVEWMHANGIVKHADVTARNLDTVTVINNPVSRIK